METAGAGSYRVGWLGVDASTQIDDRTFVRQMPFVSA
jgi:hypothetical protein